MKKISVFTIIFALITNSSLLFADADTVIEKQRADCVANTAHEWSATKNRCVDKVEAGSYRKDSVACDKLTDMEQKKACQLSLASERTGVTGSAEESMSKMGDLSTRSTVINAAGTIISVLNMLGASGGPGNTCMSKNILSATSIAGTITDILMKIKMKKKVEELEKKYQIVKTDNAYMAQYKALEYLKEEQEAVKDIAELETKRQTLLMIGYGATLATALYEQFYNTACHTPKKEPAPAPTTATTPPPETAPPPKPNASVDDSVKTEAVATPVKPQGDVVATDLPPLDSKLPEPAPVANAVVATPKIEKQPDPTIQYSKDGKTTYMIQKDTNGQVIGVYHGGEGGAMTYYSGRDISPTKAFAKDGSPIFSVNKTATGTPTNTSSLSFFKTRGRS